MFMHPFQNLRWLRHAHVLFFLMGILLLSCQPRRTDGPALGSTPAPRYAPAVPQPTPLDSLLPGPAHPVHPERKEAR
ncbi:MAG: hypothetical protein IPK21_18770 [Haliscomenobacter sp.]|nr:hypothetical protein [Haliscomenobacter sp.]